ncbi:MAG: nucleotidyl transferase AbiEii/AbiGii toxin family protein [Deltaproteobacteria bacterium]|nr:nucleotidyl transferase AbiEii/AbiGii toxin family protein [Deltaproteobacteria bacterium]
MSKPELPAIRFHEDSVLFQESMRFTAAETAFTARLIEKDYFCTVLLAYLAVAGGDDLVFKGGTCLAKVHADLYRLSEDLDFAISMPVKASRSERSKRAEGVKRAVAALSKYLPGFRAVQPLKGSNNSMQYTAVAGYTSLLDREEQTIKIEVGLREPLLMPPVEGLARTLLLDPITANSLVPLVSVRCMSKTEALAEKFRAALSRRETAVRDFYDIDHAVRKGGLRPDAIDLVKQVKEKLAVPGNEPVDVSSERLAALRKQLEPQLRSVLREQDFVEFDLERAFNTVAQMAEAVR